MLSAEPFVKNAEDLARIERAVPARAIVPPAKPRRLLIFTLNVGYGGHPSIAYADEAFTLMGRKTGAWETVVSDDPAIFERDSLRRFDAVFFNNTVGNCFTNRELRENLLEFVVGGGGLLGVHGTTVAFTRWPGAFEDWPEFGYMIGARGANHKASNEHIWIKLDDPAHPLNHVFGGKGFDYRDEFFRPQGTYSRSRVRVLLSIDTAKTDVDAGQPRGNCYRADNDYAVAWVRNYGRGRVFYSTIAHNPYVFWDSRMLQFYLAALQFALGDLAAPTTPSDKLTPAVLAQEKLGWRLGVDTSSFQDDTLFEVIEKAARLRTAFITANSSQTVSREIPKRFGPQLTDSELSQVRLKLEAAGLRLVSFEVETMPTSESNCRELFEFGRKMGIEVFASTPCPELLDILERLCQQYQIGFAMHNLDRKRSRKFWSSKQMLQLCRGRNPYIGVCGDVACWSTGGVDPLGAARLLKQRLLAIQLRDWPLCAATGLSASEASKREAEVIDLLAEFRHLGLKPALFSLATASNSSTNISVLTSEADAFNRAMCNLPGHH